MARLAVPLQEAVAAWWAKQLEYGKCTILGRDVYWRPATIMLSRLREDDESTRSGTWCLETRV